MNHLNVIRIIDYISGVILLIIGFFFVFLFFAGAGVFGIVGDLPPELRAILAVIFGTLGLIIGGSSILFGILSFFAGNAIVNRQYWSKVYHIIVAIFNILAFPVGTAISIYFLWVLLFNEETKDLFATSESSSDSVVSGT